MKTLCVLLKFVQLFGAINFSLCSSDGMIIADFCNGSMMLFSDTFSVLPGTDVIITCSLPDSVIFWISSFFSTLALVPPGLTTASRLDGAIVFSVTEVEPTLPCITATVTIANISESLQGLDLTCNNGMGTMSSTVNIDVIDPPLGMVVFDTDQDCSNIVTNWTALPDNPNPIIGYNIIVSGSFVSLAADQTNYTHPISDSDCGNTIEMYVFAVSATGAGSITTNSLMIVCTHTNISVVSISDTNAVVQWTPVDVTGVMGYEVMSMNVEESPTGSTAAFVPANVDMASVLVDDYTIPVTFMVTSLLTGNETCYASQTTLPALKNVNQITTNFGAGTVTFLFLHAVMTSSLSINLSPANGTCVGDVSEMDVIVNCSGLTNDVEYIVTVEITLIVNGGLLPVSFSESFTPTAPPLLSSTASGCNYGFAVGLSVSLTFLITFVLSSLLTVLVTWCLCVGGREKKTTPTSPASLYEIPSTDPGKESLKISPNVAYGHVQPRSTAHAGSMYDSVAL